MAHASGVPQPTISRAENGLTVSRMTAVKIADALGVASEVMVSETMRDTVKAVRELIEAGEDVTRNTLAKKFGIVASSAGRRFGPASAAGFLKEDPDNPNQKPKRYVLDDVPLPGDADVIPDPEIVGSCVSASGARGEAGEETDRAPEDFSNARSDASVRTRSSDFVALEEDKAHSNGQSGKHHDDENHENALSPHATHARTIFENEPEVAEKSDTVRAPVLHIVRPDLEYPGYHTRTGEPVFPDDSNPEELEQIADAMRLYMLEEYPIGNPDRYNAGHWALTLGELGYGYYSEESVAGALQEHGDELYLDAA